MFHTKAHAKTLHRFIGSIGSETEFDVHSSSFVKCLFSNLEVLGAKIPVNTSVVVLIRAVVTRVRATIGAENSITAIRILAG
jgi:hypothetical protein